MGLWDASALPPRDQFEYWREAICREFVALSPVKTGSDAGFASKVETSLLGSLNRASVVSKAQITRHGPAEIDATDGSFFFVNLQVAGRCFSEVRGQSSVVEPGEFVVVDTTEPYEFVFDGDWQMLSFRVPHGDIDDSLVGYRSRLGMPMGDDGVGRAVTSLMRVMWGFPSQLPAVSVRASVECFEASVVAALSSAPLLSTEDVGSAPLRAAILDHVRRNLGDPQLNVSQVSKAFAISPRTLHSLFEGTGMSFSRTVRNLRLERAHEVLSDPASTLSVTELAQRSGFYDPSAFTRAFRRRFGLSPAEQRRSVPAQTAQ